MEAAISLEKVNKTLNGRRILKDVSFTVEHGDIFGYLGPNGAGKTTTIRILLGLLKVGSGRASVLGKDVSIDSTRTKVGFVLEADGLYDSISAYANIAYYAELYGVPRSRPIIEEMLRSAGLADRAKDKVANFSKGMRQRLALARAMMPNPDLLILDEPTSGIDPSGQIEVRQLILDMAHRQGKTILLSSHNLDEVQRICNRIALISRGEIKLFGKLDELQRQGGKGEVVIETSEPVAEDVLADLKGLSEVGIRSREDKTLVLSIGPAVKIPDITSLLSRHNVGIEQVIRRQASLEEIYTTILKEAGQ